MARTTLSRSSTWVVAVMVAASRMASAQTSGSSEPFKGTWLLNVAKSAFAEPSPPKARVLVIETMEDDFVYSIETTNADGSKVRLRYTVPIRGGTGRFIEGPYDAVVHRRIDAHMREAEYFRAGTAIVAFTGRVSPDGRVLRITARNPDDQGRETESVSVYDKQQR